MKLINSLIYMTLACATGLTLNVYATDQECRDKWRSSGASKTCIVHDMYITATGSGSCKIDKVSCPNGSGQSTTYTDAIVRDGYKPAKIEALENVGKLNNCKGDLRVGGC